MAITTRDGAANLDHRGTIATRLLLLRFASLGRNREHRLFTTVGHRRHLLDPLGVDCRIRCREQLTKTVVIRLVPARLPSAKTGELNRRAVLWSL